MSEIDIRDNVEDRIDTIRIEDESIHCIVELLLRDGSYIYMRDSDPSVEMLRILSKEHALNIKKAIDKAIELEWWD